MKVHRSPLDELTKGLLTNDQASYPLRLRTVRQMLKEGYVCPALPVAWIKAENEKQAKKILLAMVSQYGAATPESLHKFMFDSEITLEMLKLDFKVPEINVENFAIEFFQEFPDGAAGKEVDESAGDKVKMAECPKCGEKFPV